MEVKKIGVWSFAKITTVFGFLGGILSLVMLAILQKLPLEQLGMQPVSITGTMILFSLLYYTVAGLVMGLLTGLIYNITAKLVGGIKIEGVSKK